MKGYAMSRWAWILRKICSRLWIRASLYGIIAAITALSAIYLKQFIPADLSQRIGADAVDGILNIMAASMLSVTIFSLSTMVSAYGAATNNVTPRATKLLIEDKISQTALSTFIGAFIFSIVGIIALKTGAYGESGRLILFIVTVAVVIMVVMTLLRWIEYLSNLGRVNQTIKLVEQTAATALEWRLRNPYLGGQTATDLPSGSVPVYAGRVGYVQHIDMKHLSDRADSHNLHIHVQALPGKFLDAHYPLVYVSGTTDENILADIGKAFIIDDERSFTQDPRYGIAVLCEVGTRGLSAAINDTGTPIFIIGSAVRVLSLWAKREEIRGRDYTVDYPRVFVPALKLDDLFDDFFPAMSRDSAGIVEVHIRLQKAYAAFIRTGDSELTQVALQHSASSYARAKAALSLEADIKRLEACLPSQHAVQNPAAP